MECDWNGKCNPHVRVKKRKNRLSTGRYLAVRGLEDTSWPMAVLSKAVSLLNIFSTRNTVPLSLLEVAIIRKTSVNPKPCQCAYQARIKQTQVCKLQSVNLELNTTPLYSNVKGTNHAIFTMVERVGLISTILFLVGSIQLWKYCAFIVIAISSAALERKHSLKVSFGTMAMGPALFLNWGIRTCVTRNETRATVQIASFF